MSVVLELLQSGAGNLAAYLAAHVLLCLVPAFFIAGAMAALIPKASITRWLGRDAPYRVSYPAAAAAGSLLAVCSCTIVPLFAGIYKKGAGLGPAITFLFFAPAGNILALAYTGSILGAEFAFARFVLSLLFGIGIGLMMALLFWRDDASHDAQTDTLFAEQASMGSAATGVLLSLPRSSKSSAMVGMSSHSMPVMLSVASPPFSNNKVALPTQVVVSPVSPVVGMQMLVSHRLSEP